MRGNWIYRIMYDEYQFPGDTQPRSHTIAMVMNDGDRAVPVLGEIRRALSKELALDDSLLGVKSIHPVAPILRPGGWRPIGMSPAQWDLLDEDQRDAAYLGRVDVFLGRVRELNALGAEFALAVHVDTPTPRYR